ncbi:MAG: hypothetical protein COA79_06110 [Planctomycetota bacterium]|nr:MAG: hypothetical protein COA79_06110 [Planctomycetota bacterium]
MNQFIFSPGAWSIIVLYIFVLLVIGWFGKKARKKESLKEFYLAGNGFGFIVLVLTLYATQYSGNTLLGFTGRAHKVGFSWVMSLHFMTAIVVFYLIFAPKLYTLSKKYSFITPTDYLNQRFSNKGINIIATIIMVLGLINYLLSQFIAMGRLVEGLTDIDPFKAFVIAVVGLAIVMLIYESLGGLRAVAWTDVIQGFILFIGFGVLIALVLNKYGSMGEITQQIFNNPEISKKAMPPAPVVIRGWFSYILIVGMGAALYPQAIQRIYAAKSAKTLRRSLQVMAFFPLTTTLIALVVGIFGIIHFSTLENSDQVLSVMLSDIQNDTTVGYWLVVILFAAVLAAIMSTADSALLAISSMLTKDIYSGIINKTASEETLTKLGKKISIFVVIILIGLAILLRNEPIVKLLDKKFDMLIQLVPAFFIGIHWKRLRPYPVFFGILIGLIIAIGLSLIGHNKPFNIHAGIYGLIVNLFISIGFSLFSKDNEIREIS